MKWSYLLLVFGVLVFIRFILNYFKYKRIQKLQNVYMRYLANFDNELLGYKQEIISLFKEAGLEDFMIIHQQFLGFGNYANMQVSGLDNMTNNRKDIVENIVRQFAEAEGVFRKRFRESFNPLFWIEYFIKLPQFTLQFLGVVPEKLVVKICLMIYWLLAVFFGLRKLDILDYLLK
jgi:hypothetical protein